MKEHGITRREWLTGAGCLGLSMVPACSSERVRLRAIDRGPYPRNAAEGLRRLELGNRRFMEDRPIHTPLVVVMGHENCWAVTATVDEMLGKTEKRRHIEALLALIKPGLSRLDQKMERQALIQAAVEMNVRWSMGN